MYSRRCQRIDVVFDNCNSDNVKSWERKRQTAGVTAIATKISHIGHPLPPASELPNFGQAQITKSLFNNFLLIGNRKNMTVTNHYF